MNLNVVANFATSMAIENALNAARDTVHVEIRSQVELITMVAPALETFQCTRAATVNQPTSMG